MIGYICLTLAIIWALTAIGAFYNMSRLQSSLMSGDMDQAFAALQRGGKAHLILGGISAISGIAAIATFIWFLIDKYAG